MIVFVLLVEERDKSLVIELGDLDKEDHKLHSHVFYSIVEVVSKKTTRSCYISRYFILSNNPY